MAFLSRLRLAPSLSLVLLGIFLLVLLGAGGGARADILGQTVVRTVAALFLIVAILFGPRPTVAQTKPVWLFLIVIVVLTLVQLIPLPPSIWEALPGRAVLVEAAAASGQAQPWRPWSLVPGATVNAAASLIVPTVTLVLICGLRENERALLPILALAIIAVSTLIGVLQFSGAAFDNRLINDTPGVASGSFANRNHFALFVAMGCLIVPAWAFSEGAQPRWRMVVAVGLIVLFVLVILATGSRTGMVLGAVALTLGFLAIRSPIRKALKRYPRWVFPALVAGIVALIGVFVWISVAADRAVSINRIFAVEAAQDLRARALPTVLEMIRTYFPWGSGLGGFDPIFRMHEPFDLLAVTYFNHAHNDFLETALDAGLPGILLLFATLLWWAWASIRSWRAGASARFATPKIGSGMLLLIFIASLFDYPARTPMIMAMAVMAGVWLCGPIGGRPGSALPKSG